MTLHSLLHTDKKRVVHEIVVAEKLGVSPHGSYKFLPLSGVYLGQAGVNFDCLKEVLVFEGRLWLREVLYFSIDGAAFQIKHELQFTSVPQLQCILHHKEVKSSCMWSL